MAGGNYHNQLYNYYANLTEEYEVLVTEQKNKPFSIKWIGKRCLFHIYGVH